MASRPFASLVLRLQLVVLAVAIGWPVLAQTPPPAAPPAATQQPAQPPAPSAAPPSTLPAPAPASPAPPASAAAPPPAPLPLEVSDAIARLTTVLEGAEKSIARMKDIEEDLGKVRDDVEGILTKTTEVADRLRPRLTAIRSQIDKLGPAPARDAPPEAPAVAAERARLTSEAVALDGAIKTLELTWVRARQMIEKITDLRYTMFTRSLMERMASPVLPAIWRDLWRDSPPVGRLINYIVSDWLHWASMKRGWVLLTLIAGIAAFWLTRLAVARLTRRPEDPGASPPSFFERAARVAWTAPLRSLPLIVSALVVYGGLDALELLYYPSDRIGAALLRAIVLFAFVAALIRGALAPREPRWRLVELSDRAARRMSLLLQAIAAAYAADLATTTVNRALYVPLSMSVVQSFVASTAYAGLLAGLLLTPFEPAGRPADRPYPLIRPRWLKLPMWGLVAVIVVTTILGYVALGRFVAQQIVMTGVIALAATLLYLAIRAFTREPERNGHPVGQMLETRFGIDAPRRRQLARLTEIALTLTLVILALPVILLQWGFSGADIRDWVKAAVFGFEVGQFRISLARILIGILLFTLLLFATRLFQRWMRDNVLVPPRVDAGIANSIDTAIGYAGVAVAALIAVSYAGFDITSLAIVAGALSVGIGFGLQSIVNNFVSGLILLVERPIKVGDWIVVGNEQGNVRRISVRSTEIETFDKASLIVPNSELITGRVLNWTHRNNMGRLVLRVNVGYSSDPKKVLGVLDECARRHKGILRTPEPKAAFDNFGANALEFSLRVHVGDINKALDVQTELRAAMLEGLRAAGINIPVEPPPPPPPASEEAVRKVVLAALDRHLAGKA